MKNQTGNAQIVFRLCCLISIVVISTLGCDKRAQGDPVKAGEIFLEALSEHDFEAAIRISTDRTATFLLLLQDMLAANEESQEDLDFPIPKQGAEIILLSKSELQDSVRMEFQAGERLFVLEAYTVGSLWFIELPRESW